MLGFTPEGFSGLCIFPSTIYESDLLVSFDTQLTSASILYAPEEYGTDSSCTMRMTAYLGTTYVGTNTHQIPNGGTWPSGTLSFSSTSPFDNIVIHYDAPPPTGGDYGPIFMADNLVVTPGGGTATPTPTVTPTLTPTPTPTPCTERCTPTPRPRLTPRARPTPPPHLTPVPPPPSPRPTAWPRPTSPPHITPVPTPSSPRPTPVPRPERDGDLSAIYRCNWMRVYEVRPRKDKRGVGLVSDRLQQSGLSMRTFRKFGS